MHLTETALINVTDNILKAIDEKSALLPVLLDMSKAFDNLNCNLLSKKLRKLGLKASLTSRFSSYLYIQQISKSTIQILSFRIVTLNKWSTSGINLGSCVITHSQPTTYVDDSKLYFKYSVRDSPSAMAAVNQDLRNMSKWCAESSLLIDLEKTKLDNLLGGYFISPYPCQDKTITPVSFAKDLRVYIDQYLTYNVHITKPASGCMNQLVPKSRIEHLLDKKTLLLLTNSFVFSKLFYCSLVQGNTSKRNIHKLQLVQNFAARVVLGVRKFDYISQRRSLSWLDVTEKVSFNDLVLAFKCVNGLAPDYLGKYFVKRSAVHNKNTRE